MENYVVIALEWNIFSLTANFKNLLNFKTFSIQRYLQLFLQMYFLKIDLAACLSLEVEGGLLPLSIYIMILG